MEFIHLRLDKWRNFYSVDVGLRSRVFIVGPNASGKSNLLDAFRFLRDIASVGGGFEDAVQRRGGVSKIRSLSARRYPEVSVAVVVGERGEEEPRWSYTLGFEQDNQSRPFITNDEVYRSGTRLLKRPDAADNADRERLRQP